MKLTLKIPYSLILSNNPMSVPPLLKFKIFFKNTTPGLLIIKIVLKYIPSDIPTRKWLHNCYNSIYPHVHWVVVLMNFNAFKKINMGNLAINYFDHLLDKLVGRIVSQ